MGIAQLFLTKPGSAGPDPTPTPLSVSVQWIGSRPVYNVTGASGTTSDFFLASISGGMGARQVIWEISSNPSGKLALSGSGDDTRRVSWSGLAVNEQQTIQAHVIVITSTEGAEAFGNITIRRTA